MEKSHGPHCNPKLLVSASNYVKYDLLGLRNAMVEQYSDLVTIKAWPALIEFISEGNLGGV